MDASDDAAVGRILHAQFLGGDIDSFNEVFRRFHNNIYKHVWYKASSHKAPMPDKDMVADATSRGLMDYFRSPQKYDPTQSSLLSYLKNAAYRDYLNEWDKEFRQTRRVVEIKPEGWNTFADEDSDPREEAERQEANDRGEAMMRALGKSDEELIIARQIIDGVGDAEMCIVELGWPPGQESVRRLYREKDKLMKRFKRNLPKLLGEDFP
jgi:DNA-directed RNA polymerase specialized sigma24 family protein